MATRREAERRVFGEQLFVGGETAEAYVLVRMIQRQLELAPPASIDAALGFGRDPETDLPEQLAAGEPQAVASSDPHEGFDCRAFERWGSASNEVADTPERTMLLAFLDGRSRGRFTPVPDEAETN